MVGIYKITSPSGRVYIGQSEEIHRRWNNYSTMNVSTRSQTKLWRSFKKYGVINHIFDIIEECLFEDLNCRERYWQDHYDVLNGGLNCILQECGEKRKILSEETKKLISENRIKKGIAKEGNNGNSKKVINYKTGEILDCGKTLSRIIGMGYIVLMEKLSGKKYNNTDWCLFSDYENENYKNNLKPATINSGKDVICTITLNTWRNITTCAKENSIIPERLISYLNPNNNRKNPTSFIYLKDYKQNINS